MKFTCEKNALVSAISVASRTVAQKSTIPALEGIYIRAGVKLTLSGYNLETGITISVDADIQETGASLKEAEKILGDTDETCTFFLGSKHILFTIGEATLVCRLLEGEFLDWRRVLPQNQPIKLAVNVAKMTDSIERVGLIISEKLKSPVRCRFGENTADFRSVSTIGEAHDVCQIAGDGQDMEIGFNCRYLLDALRAIPDSECSLELVNGLSPIVMNPCDGSGRYSYMVLPVRLKAGE